MRLNSFGRRFAPAILLGTSVCACAPGTGEETNRGSGSGGGTGDGTGGVGTGLDGVGGGVTGGPGSLSSGGARGGGDSPDASCAATSVRAETIEVTTEVEVPVEIVEEVPTVLYLMLDRSGSMVQDSFDLGGLLGGLFGGGTGTAPPDKWSYAVGAISTFAQDPNSTGLRAALHYFPGGGNCDGTGYEVPTVPMVDLTGGATQIITSLQAQAPGGNTPTAGALRGATTYCAAFNAASPAEQCVVVLITDGQPTDCDPRDGAGLGAIAQQALTASNVKTYTVGMDGADFNVLNTVAQMGDGDCTPNDPATFACDVTAGSGNSFLAALELIRSRTSTTTRTEYKTEVQSTVLACEWAIPPPPDGEEFDADLVNVRFQAGGGSAQSIGAVATESDCAGVETGWYYDDLADPQNVRVCPQTCTVIQSVTDAQVDVLLGCATEPAILR